MDKVTSVDTKVFVIRVDIAREDRININSDFCVQGCFRLDARVG